MVRVRVRVRVRIRPLCEPCVLSSLSRHHPRESFSYSIRVTVSQLRVMFMVRVGVRYHPGFSCSYSLPSYVGTPSLRNSAFSADRQKENG